MVLDPSGVKLFYELSSESRLSILEALMKESLKMQELARRVDLTATEAFRQLQRLSDAKMVQRRPDSSYEVTRYGRLEMWLTSSLVFASTYKEYFLSHDIMALPQQFIGRLGELSGSEFIEDTMAGIKMTEDILGRAKEYVWGIGEGRFTEGMGTMSSSKHREGVEFRVLSPQPPFKMPNLETRTLTPLPLVLAVTESEAMVGLRSNEGNMDYTGFAGRDKRFLDWSGHLFQFYWDKA